LGAQELREPLDILDIPAKERLKLLPKLNYGLHPKSLQVHDAEFCEFITGAIEIG